MFKETEAMALFSNSQDRDTFIKKMSTAITHGETFIIVPNIDKDLSKDEIRFGFTRPDNTTDIRARLYIYNTQGGRKIQVSSGKSVSFILMDEIAKDSFKQVYDVLEPALLSDTGELRCSPIMAFTGGEVDKSKDAENLVKNPVDNQFKTNYEDSITGQVKVIGGRLLDGLYRKDCKEITKFSDYIGQKTNTWLDDTIIYVSNKQKALEKILFERKEAEKSTDPKSLLLKKIFFPLCLDDIFLSESNNKFNIPACKQQKEWLKNHYTPMYVDLYRRVNTSVDFRFSELRPIDKFPVKPQDNKIAPICMYEFPVENAPFGTYCIGIDPINNDDSNDNIVSLASIFVYKRMISPLDQFKNQLVATWTGRYSSLQEFHELALMIAEFYDAKKGVLPEASENTLIQYFFHKKKGVYLADSFELIRDINLKFKGAASKKGLPATATYQKNYMNLLVEYTNEEEMAVDEEGNETPITGISKIYDPMLLEELIQYKGKTSGQGVHDINVDRVVSMGCALTLARHYDIAYPIALQKPKSNNPQDIYPQKQLNTMFGVIEKNNNTPFSNPKPRGRGSFRMFG